MKDVYFSNIEQKKGTEYFLYIGELKNYGLTHFLRDTLEREYQHRFDVIAIVPDLFEQYHFSNIMVINPDADEYACRFGTSTCCRVSFGTFMKHVSGSREVRTLIQQILDLQEHLYLYMYESLPEMTLDDIPGVSILGPDKYIAKRINSKIFQMEALSDKLPTVEHLVCNGHLALDRMTRNLWHKWRNGIFITREYSAAGINSLVADSREAFVKKFGKAEGPYLISRFMPHEHDPTVLAIVDGEGNVYIAGVADQNIEGGNRFTGSTFPSVLDKETQEKLKAYTTEVGRWMAEKGYRGIFGCDYIVTADGQIYFLEVNARKQGTTLEFCCTLEQSLPAGTPSLTDLEFHAVTKGLFPPQAREMAGNAKNLHWGTYNYKILNPVKTKGYLPHNAMERDVFRKVAEGSLKKDFLILEHVGNDLVVAEGAFIGRVVSLGKDPESVNQGLIEGRKAIELTFEKHQCLMDDR